MLKKTDFKYMFILWLAWVTADYYQDLFQLEPDDDPAKVRDYLLKYNDYRVVRVYFPKKFDEPRRNTVLEIKQIINEYFDHVLMPRQKILKPYVSGNSYYDVSEAVYVIDVFENSDEMGFDILYIDNDEAYKTKRYDEQMEAARLVKL